jgi:DNA anti-recombination protein RmuC
MSDRQLVPFGPDGIDTVDPDLVATLQQSANVANENCDRAIALAHKLAGQLREAQDRINQLEQEADGLFDRSMEEANAAVEKVQSNADARVHRTIQEADERIARLEAAARNQIGRLQNELAHAARGIDQVKAEADACIERIKVEAEARVAAAQSEAKKRIDFMRGEIDDKVIGLEVGLAELKNRAERAEQWLKLIRREMEDHLMPSLTAMHDLMRPEGN